jgi:hypothetical protein
MENKGNGNIISQERKVKEFDGIALYGIGNINIHFAEDYKVIVTTDSNIQDFVEIEISDSTLSIEKKRENYYPTKLTIDVFLPELKSIISNGAGNVEFIDRTASDLKIILSGSGVIDAVKCRVQNVDVTLSGSGNIKIGVVNTLKAYLTGSGGIDAENCQVQNADVTLTGCGNIKLWATETLNAILTGTGDILYKGNPKTNIVITGIGKVKQI